MINEHFDRYARLTRFFAHLCLFFNHIEVDISPLSSQKILEAYVSVLEVHILYFVSYLLLSHLKRTLMTGPRSNGLDSTICRGAGR